MAELAALGAALCWAIGSLIAADASRLLGGIAFTRIREYLVLAMLLPVAFWIGGSLSDFLIHWPSLTASGLIGIFIGDTALFVALSRLGPRLTGMLFATNAPMTMVLSWWLLGEHISPRELLGSVLVVVGVLVSIGYGKSRHQKHVWESVYGALPMGIAIGLLAALGQSVGSLLAMPALDAGLHAVPVATFRIAVATVAMVLMALLLPRFSRARQPLTAPLAGRVALSGLFGMAIGMTLLLFAFSHGQVGISATLSATTPVILLPLIWLVSGERPAAGAWLGAVLAVIGTGLIVA